MQGRRRVPVGLVLLAGLIFMGMCSSHFVHGAFVLTLQFAWCLAAIACVRCNSGCVVTHHAADKSLMYVPTGSITPSRKLLQIQCELTVCEQL